MSSSAAQSFSSTTSASQLLDILRGTAPVPSPAASQRQATVSLGGSSYSTAQSSSSSAQAQGQAQLQPGMTSYSGQPGAGAAGNGDLDRLFKNAFGGQPHPSSSSASSASPAPASGSPSPQSPLRRTPAVVHQSSPAPAPASAAFVFGSPGGFGGLGSPARHQFQQFQQQQVKVKEQPQSKEERSANLLNLLQGMGGSAPPSAMAQEKEDHYEDEGQRVAGREKRARKYLPGSEAPIGREESYAGAIQPGSVEEVSLLLGQAVSRAAPPVGNSQKQQEQQEEQSPLQTQETAVESVKESAPASAPNFANFVSPFDLLAKAHAAEQAQARASVSSDSSSPAKAAVEVEQAVMALDFTSNARSSPAPAPGPAQAQTEVEPTRSLLASQYLASSSSSSSSGLQLPLLPTPQHLSIDVSLPHIESLLSSSSPVQHTPVTLFPIAPSFSLPASASKVGVWPRALVYATAKGRVRVIDRENGGRVLLKSGGKKEIVDLQVAGGVDARGRRTLGATAVDGRLVIWRVRDDMQGENGGEKLLEIHSLISTRTTPGVGSDPRFPLIRFHPRFPAVPTLGVALNDGRMFLLDLGEVLEGGQGETGDEGLLFRMGKGAQCSSSIIDFSFSPEGTAFVVLTSDGTYSIRKTAAPTEVVYSSALDDAASTEAFTGVSFLTSAEEGARPSALLVTSKQGTQARIVSLGRGDSGADGTTISFDLPTSSDIAPALHFSHHAFNIPSSTLYLSSSLRGSLFAFRLAFPSGSSSNATDDVAWFASLSSSASQAQKQAVQIEHVAEIPTSEPVLGFALDDSQSAIADGKKAMGALVMHPGGIHQVLFEQSDATSASASEAAVGAAEGGETAEECGAGGRRMSLESSIHVTSEVEVSIDEVDPVSVDLIGAKAEEGAAVVEAGEISSGKDTKMLSGLNLKREPSITPIQEEPPALPTPSAEQDSALVSPSQETLPPISDPAASNSTLAADTATEPTSVAADTLLANRDIKLSGSAVNAAIRSMKKNKDKSVASPTPSSPVSERVVKVESPSPAPAILPDLFQPQQAKSPAPASSSRSDPIANAWATGIPPAKKSKKEEVTAEVLKEFRKMEEGLPAKIAKLVGHELDKHAQRAEEERLNDQAADTARQETMLKLVSTTLAKSTSRLVESTIKDQIKQQVIPSINKLVSAAVHEQIGAGLAAGLKETLPNEMEKVLLRPDVTAHLTRNFSTAIAPSLERSLMSVVTQGVIPPFNQLLSRAVDACVASVHREMVDVRKEIVKEQSDAVVGLEEEVHSLRQDVVDLKAALQRMEGIVTSLKSAPPQHVAPPPAAAVVSPRHQQQQQPQQQRPAQRQMSGSHLQQQQQQQSSYSLPPIPRAPTPPEAYEETFTNLLQPQHEPSFSSLMHLISSAPSSRQDSVFPSAPQQPKLSPPVILSLAYRLAQVIGTDASPLNEDGRKQLSWLRRSLTSMDPSRQSVEVAEFTPRILESVVASLHARAKQLHALQDRRGVEELRAAEAYARAQLRMFVEGGVRETFKR